MKMTLLDKIIKKPLVVLTLYFWVSMIGSLGLTFWISDIKEWGFVKLSAVDASWRLFRGA